MNWHWLRHDWGKWAEPYWALWRTKGTLNGVVVSSEDTQKLTQARTCNTCGQVEYRTL